MSRTYRALLLWLIAIAIPLQGLAAVVWPLAMSGVSIPVANGGSNRAGAEAMDGVHGHQQGHQPGHQQAHQQEQAHPAAGHGAGNAATPDVDPPCHSGHSMLKCCSAACSLLAYIPPSLAKHSPMPSVAPVQAEAAFCPDVFLDGLDRPPKRFLA